MVRCALTRDIDVVDVTALRCFHIVCWFEGCAAVVQCGRLQFAANRDIHSQSLAFAGRDLVPAAVACYWLFLGDDLDGRFGNNRRDDFMDFMLFDSHAGGSRVYEIPKGQVSVFGQEFQFADVDGFCRLTCCFRVNRQGLMPQQTKFAFYLCESHATPLICSVRKRWQNTKRFSSEGASRLFFRRWKI